MEIKILPPQESDAKRLAEVYNLSFYADYIKYGECPGYHKTEEHMLSNRKSSDVYKILVEDTIVGAISVKKEAPGHYFLGALCVIPEYANRGIGQQAMRFLECRYPDAAHWALETPADKYQNHYFYQKFGFSITREYRDGRVPVVRFERFSREEEKPASLCKIVSQKENK